MWKMCHLKTTTMPVIVRALGMITKGTDKHINKIPGGPSQYEIPFVELLLSLRDWLEKISPKSGKKHINSLIEYNHYLPSG